MAWRFKDTTAEKITKELDTEVPSPKEMALKRRIAKDAGRLSALSAMKLNRHQRRALAKANGGTKIPGSNRPVVSLRHEKREETSE